MNFKQKNIYVIFGTLFVTSVILALIASPLRGTYFNDTSFMDKVLIVTGFDNGKIKSVRALTDQISQASGLEIPSNSNSKKITLSRNGANASIYTGSSKQNANYFKSQPYNYDLTAGQSSSSGTEATAGSSNQSQNVSSGIPFSSGLVANNSSNSNKKTLNPNNSVPGYVSVFTDLSKTQLSGEGNNRNGAGGPPPDSGGDNPPSPPNLPIGNGVNFMMVLAFAFGGWKVIKSSF